MDIVKDQIPAGTQMVQIGCERLDRVDIALGEAERAGGGGGEGIDERQLDQVVALTAAGDKAARFGENDADLRTIVQMAGEIGVGLLDEPHELGVELDRIDLRGPMVERPKDIGAAAGAKDQNPRPLDQMVGQRRCRVVEIGERRQPAVESGDRAEPIAVGEDAELSGRLDRTTEAEAGNMAERDRRAPDDGQQAERARPLRQHLRTGDEERQRQPLVLREPQADP